MPAHMHEPAGPEPPFTDVRVRHAMQMALDLEAMNDSYFQRIRGYDTPGDWSAGNFREAT